MAVAVDRVVFWTAPPTETLPAGTSVVLMLGDLGVGDGVGDAVGDGVGDGVGDAVGDGVGDGVGDAVGDGVGSNWFVYVHVTTPSAATVMLAWAGFMLSWDPLEPVLAVQVRLSKAKPLRLGSAPSVMV